MAIFIKAVWLSLCGVMFMSHVQSAHAEPFEDGVVAYNIKDYEKAMAHWRVAANDGHGESQFNLGYMFENGQGVERSIERAIFWYEKAIQQGYAEAGPRRQLLKGKSAVVVPEPTHKRQNEPRDIQDMPRVSAEIITDKAPDTIPQKPMSREALARMYFTGTGVKKSYKTAVRLYEEAANQGDLSAQNQLAVLYTYGLYGVERSQQKSAHWFAEAAKQGDVSAMYTTGVNYYEGRGVEKSLPLAIGWFEQAAAQGYAAAKLRLQAIRPTVFVGK